MAPILAWSTSDYHAIWTVIESIPCSDAARMSTVASDPGSFAKKISKPSLWSSSSSSSKKNENGWHRSNTSFVFSFIWLPSMCSERYFYLLLKLASHISVMRDRIWAFTSDDSFSCLFLQKFVWHVSSPLAMSVLNSSWICHATDC